MAVQTIDLIAPTLVDAFQRPITYLRVSVTDKCNLRCIYCMPESGLPWLPKSDILSYEEIVRIVSAAAALGVTSVRITGGEPLVRRNLEELIAALARIRGVDDIALSTNGLRLSAQLDSLVRAGLTRVNISLDTLREDRFEELARRPGLRLVLQAIDDAIAAGLGPVKINCVVMRGRNADELLDFARLTVDRAVYVRFIELMPAGENAGLQTEAYISAATVLEEIGRLGDLHEVDGPSGNGPARYFAFPGAAGAVGVISPLSHDYCDRCNRVRLTADGRLRLCLFGDQHIDLRTPLRAGASDEHIGKLLQGAMRIKPQRHHLQLGQAGSRMRAFSEIGG